METLLSNKFKKLINKYIDYNKLCSEKELESTSEDQQERKKIKYSHNKASGKIIEVLINDSLKEYITKNNVSYNEVLDHQINALVEVYKNKSVYNDEMLKVTTFIKCVISEKVLNQQDVFAAVITKIASLPFSFIWRLTKLEIFSLEQFINRIKNNEAATDNLLINLEKLIFKDIEDSSSEDILKDILLTLIRLSYELKSVSYQVIQNVSNKLLLSLLSKLLKRINKENETQSLKDFINIFDFILSDDSLNESAVKKFASNQLVSVLTFEPEMRLTYAIEQQSKWRSTSFNKVLSSILLSLVKMIGCEGSFSTLDNVVSSLEVNWSIVLTFLGTLLLAFPESSSRLKEVIDSYIRKGNETQESEFLILGFLYSRHASMEGRHVFPGYPQWFAATFGSENSSPANNKQAFNFMIKFLTSLVPYESAQCLRAHISQSIFVPKGCQSVLRDYQRMAKCRLQDLNEETGGSSSSKFGISESKISADVESAVAQYSQAGKVPSFVLEAAIFNRQFYISSFLPLLLTPRHLPNVHDARMNLIKELNSLGNIPEKMYRTYQEKCEALRSVPVAMEMEDNIMSDPSSLHKIKEHLKQYKELAQSDDDRDNRDNRCMHLLSTLTQYIEEATASVDATLRRDDSTMIVNTNEFNSDDIQYQVVAAVFKTIKSMLDLKTSPFLHRRVGQLISLLASTPSVQLATVVSFIQTYDKLGKEKCFSTTKVGFYGILLSEILNHSGMFLPMKLVSSVEVIPSTVEDILLGSFPFQDPEFFLFSCCLLQSALNWNSSSVEETSGNPVTPKKLSRIYFFVASRCIVMKTDRMIHSADDDDDKLISNTTDYFPVIAGEKIPKCCQFLMNNFLILVKEITLDDWIKFELETSWGDTIPLCVRIKHREHWAHHFLNSGERNSSSPEKKKPDGGFLFLFWKLIDCGSCKRNSAELFILLQSLSFTNPISVSLLDEWKRWKRTFSNRSNPGEETDDNVNEYHTKLSSFMSFCHSLPPSIVCGENASMTTLNLFHELITDLLVMEGRLILTMRDTVLLLECILEAVRKLKPPSSHLVNCFALLKESVLFHLPDVMPLIKRHSDVIEKYSGLHYLLRININNPSSYKSLPDKDIAILVTSRCISNVWKDCDSIPSQYRIVMFPYGIAFLGRHLVRGGYICNYSEEELSVSSENKLLGIFVESLSGILDVFESSAEPSLLMSSWKEVSCTPLFWKLFLFGFSYLLMIKLDKKIDMKTSWHYCFLLLNFKHLSVFFEENPDGDNPPLNYLSRMSVKMNSLAKILPVRCLKSIPETLLSSCDKDLIALIRYRCTEKLDLYKPF